MHTAIENFLRKITYIVFYSWRISAKLVTTPIRTLEDHESLGGHVISRHVNLTLKELKKRLTDEPTINTVSTFWNLKAAVAAINYVISVKFSDINDWLIFGINDRNDFEADLPIKTCIGFGLHRRTHEITYYNKVAVILRKINYANFVILTAYPS